MSAEIAIVRACRLARELGEVLDELNAAALYADKEDGDVAVLTANIWPAALRRHMALESVYVPASFIRFQREIATRSATC